MDVSNNRRRLDMAAGVPDNDSQWFRAMNLQLNIARELGSRFAPGATVLDFGCGAGALVGEYRLNGFNAFGCDFQPKQGDGVEELLEIGYIRLIDKDKYRLPFEDNTFDFVVSNQVLEHVQDYAASFSEIRRVLKPGGVSLHVFPARFRIKEGHVHVPFASLIQKKWWLLIWAIAGIRTDTQKGMTATEVARNNYEYLNNHTNYVPRHEIEKTLRGHFERYCFCEKVYLKHVEKPRRLHRILSSIPLFPVVFSLLRNRVLFFEKYDFDDACNRSQPTPKDIIDP